MNETIGITSTIPIEVIYAAGASAVDINNLFVGSAEPRRFVRDAEDEGFPGNSCAWIKGLYAAVLASGIRKVVAVVQGDCSNTIALAERLSLLGVEIIPFAYPYAGDKDRLTQEFEKFMRCFGTGWDAVAKTKKRLDAIREKVWKIDECAWKDGTVSGFENHLWQVSCSDFKGDPDRFAAEADLFLREVACRKKRGGAGMIRLGYIGVPPIANNLYHVVEQAGADIIFNEVQRQFTMPFKTGDVIEQYMRYTYPYGIARKLADIRVEIQRRQLDGIILYVQSFCHHQIEADVFRRSLDIPMIVVECDKPGPVEGKDKTRIEAFIDSLRSRGKKAVSEARSVRVLSDRKKEKSTTCGIDLGSRHAKIVFMRDGKIIKEMTFDTVDFYRLFGARTGAQFHVALAGLGIEADRVIATGYGREALASAGAEKIPELQAHAAGAVFLSGVRSFVLIDIGGQDVKIMKVEDGVVAQFSMNDKCAAGTGRYLENMSRVLGVGIEALGDHYQDPVLLNATCAVFSETELTGKIAAGIPVDRLCAGVNYSAYLKFKPHVLKVWNGEPVVISGGGARNKSFARFLRKELGCEIIPVERPQYAGAIGCALQGQTLS